MASPLYPAKRRVHMRTRITTNPSPTPQRTSSPKDNPAPLANVNLKVWIPEEDHEDFLLSPHPGSGCKLLARAAPSRQDTV